MDELYSLLQQVKPTVGVLIGNNSLHTLNIYINGFLFAWYDNNPHYYKEFNELFRDFVGSKIDAKEKSSWVTMILENAQTDTNAIELFYEYYEQYYVSC